MGDAFISVDHLVMGLAKEDSRFTANAISKQDVSMASLEAALKDLRKGQKVRNTWRLVPSTCSLY